MHHMDMNIPQPTPEDPFKDDVRPLDPNTPPPGRETYYKPYWKKEGTTAAAPTPARIPAPAKLDPYAVAPPVQIKARPITAAPRVAKWEISEREPVKVAVAARDVAPVSLTITDDEPPTPPMLLPASAPLRRIEAAYPANPLRR